MSNVAESWIGRSRTEGTVLDPELARHYAAAMGHSLDVEAAFPPLGHWAYFNDIAASADLGPDGHPRPGLFMPPMSLPHSLFASATLEFHAPLTLGATATLTSSIADVRYPSGRPGALARVDVKRELAQAGRPRLTEMRSIVYHEAGEPEQQVKEIATLQAADVWHPAAVDLFRYAAATYNSDRIHYDRSYATDVAGYPDLVVQSQFTAARLFAYAQRIAGRAIGRFSFHALSPLFVDQPIYLRAGDELATVVAVRCDGRTGMSASFEIEETAGVAPRDSAATA